MRKMTGDLAFQNDRLIRVGGIHVGELSYLLQYLTANKHKSFNDIEAIADDFVQINAAILLEQGKDKLGEEVFHHLSREEALRNLHSMRIVLEGIANYFNN